MTSSVFSSSLDEEFEAGRSKLAKLRERIRRAKGVVQVRQLSKDFYTCKLFLISNLLKCMTLTKVLRCAELRANFGLFFDGFALFLCDT